MTSSTALTTEVAKAEVLTVPTAALAAAMEQVVGHGDLRRMSPEQRVAWYSTVCRSLGLNPYTRPFAFLDLQGKISLYALKDATDQLRAIHGISSGKPEFDHRDGVLYATVELRDRHGRTDYGIGAVPLSPELKGEARANTYMKVHTKALRRGTLQLCGLGFTDESEVESISGARVVNMDIDDGTFEDDTAAGPSESFANLKSARDSNQTAPTPQKRAPRARQTLAGLTAQADALEATATPTSVEEVAELVEALDELDPVMAGDFNDLPDDSLPDEPAAPEPGPLDPKPFADADAFLAAVQALLEDTNQHKEEIGLPAGSSATFAIAAQILGCERSKKGFADFYARYKPTDAQIGHLRKELIRVLKGDVGTLE